MKRQSIRKALILISFLFFPLTIYYFSPYLIIQGVSEGIITGSFLMFSFMLFGSLFFGRLFCGWICPAGGLQEACGIAVDKRHKGGWRKWVKYFIWAPWILLIVFVSISVGGLKQVDPLYQTWHGISVAEPMAYIIYYGVVALITVLALVSGRRGFCHSICWMAPFMVIGNAAREKFKIPSLRLKSESEKCISCGICTKKCTMSLDVQTMIQKSTMAHIDCILCGECIDSCPVKAISYTMSGDKG